MTVTILQNGVGGTTGAYLASAAPYFSSGTVWYVDSTRGTDAGSPAGQNREKPLATITQAVANASAGDIIVLASSHTETRTAGSQLISKAVLIVGEGSVAGVPSPTINFDTGDMSLTGANSEIHNVKFTARSAASATARVQLVANGGALRGCYFLCAGNDTGPAVSVYTGLSNIIIENCTFISTATSTSSQPESALKTAGTVTDMRIEDCVFSDGTVGFSNFYAADLSAGAITRLEIRRLSLLLGAEMKLNASTTWRLGGLTTSGGGKLVW